MKRREKEEEKGREDLILIFYLFSDFRFSIFDFRFFSSCPRAFLSSSSSSSSSFSQVKSNKPQPPPSKPLQTPHAMNSDRRISHSSSCVSISPLLLFLLLFLIFLLFYFLIYIISFPLERGERGGEKERKKKRDYSNELSIPPCPPSLFFALNKAT